MPLLPELWFRVIIFSKALIPESSCYLPIHGIIIVKYILNRIRRSSGGGIGIAYELDHRLQRVTKRINSDLRKMATVSLRNVEGQWEVITTGSSMGTLMLLIRRVSYIAITIVCQTKADILLRHRIIVRSNGYGMAWRPKGDMVRVDSVWGVVYLKTSLWSTRKW